MIVSLLTKLDNLERSVRTSFGRDISTRSGRFWAHIHFHLMDHAFLRVLWNNFHQVSDEVYRANQPSPSHLRSYKDKGIKAVLNLRGFTQQSYALFEQDSCKNLELDLISVPLSGSSAPQPEKLLEIIGLMDKISKPFVLHCKSGADRAGLVSAMYLIVQKKLSVTEAKKQLSFKYLHLDFTKTGILDYIFDVFSERLKIENIDFLDWVKREYNAEILNSCFKSRIEWKTAAIDLMEFSNAKNKR
jgi:protein tyrosine/serine phosphatase